MSPLVGKRVWAVRTRVLHMDKGLSAVLGICMKILTNDMSFHSRGWDSGKVGMSNVLSHNGDNILV